jgi:hypothetical protein
MIAEWRNHATPEEIAEHDGLILAEREAAQAGLQRRRIIRNRCRMRGKQRKQNEASAPKQ